MRMVGGLRIGLALHGRGFGAADRWRARGLWRGWRAEFGTGLLALRALTLRAMTLRTMTAAATGSPRLALLLRLTLFMRLAARLAAAAA